MYALSYTEQNIVFGTKFLFTNLTFLIETFTGLFWHIWQFFGPKNI